MKEQGQVPGRTASEQYIGQPQARTIADLERQLAEAQGKLDAVEKMVLPHEKKVAGFVEEGEHPCYEWCLACERDRILSKEGE